MQGHCVSIDKSLIIKSPSDYWYGLAAKAGAMPAKTQPTSLNSPIQRTSVKAQTQMSRRQSAKMRRALLMETRLASLMAIAIAMTTFLSMFNKCTVNKAISTNCCYGAQGGQDVLFWALSWRIKGTMRTAFLWYWHPHHKKTPHASQSSWDFHSSTATTNWPETSSLLNSDCNWWQLFEHRTVASTLNLIKEKGIKFWTLKIKC